MENELTRAQWDKKFDELLEKDKKFIGREVTPKRSGTEFKSISRSDSLITASLISAYARGAMGDPDPLYTDQDYGKYTRWGNMIAPPTFMSWFGPFIINLNPVNFPNFSIGWHASTIFDYSTNKAIKPGDEIRCIYKYGGWTEKTPPNKPYRLLDLLGTAKCYNQRDDLVASAAMTLRRFFSLPGDQGKNGVLLTDTLLKGRDKKPQYTQEQLDVIYRFYEEEMAGKHCRGAEIRYWEDVQVGEEIPTLIEGPLQVTDIYMSGIGRIGNIGSFAVAWPSIRNPRSGDSEVGAYGPMGRHMCDAAAQKTGFPFAGIVGQNEGSIAHAICNWKGDDAWVKRWEAHHLTQRSFGDMAYIKGKVTRKYSANGEHLVDLEMWEEIQSGLVISTCNVTVRLVSLEG